MRLTGQTLEPFVQHRLESTGGPVIHGKPLRRRSAAIHLWLGCSTFLGAARVPLQKSNCCPISPPQTRNDNCQRNVEGRQVNLEDSSPSMAMNVNKERTSSRCPPSVAMMCGLVPDFHPPEAVFIGRAAWASSERSFGRRGLVST